MKTGTGAERIAEERARQFDEGGYTLEGDAKENADGELALAAACYAAPCAVYDKDENTTGQVVTFTEMWPWSWAADKRPRVSPDFRLRPQTRAERIGLLVRAGALCAAEIDRLIRLEEADERKAPVKTEPAQPRPACSYPTCTAPATWRLWERSVVKSYCETHAELIAGERRKLHDYARGILEIAWDRYK